MFTPTTQREPIEWIGIRWHDEETTRGMKRVLLIGDSIVAGHGTDLRDRLKGKYAVDYFATSKTASDVDYWSDLEFMLKRYHYELIIYNNGLHGTGLPDIDYINAVEDVIGKLRQISPRVAWRTTTPCFPLPGGDNRYPEISARREKMAQELMKRLNVPVIDCRTELEKYPATSSDGIHFRWDGYHIIVEAEAAYIEQVLG